MLELILVLVLAGFGLWLLQQAPLDATIKRIIWGVVILVIVLYVLHAFGLLSGPLPRLRG